MDLSPNLWNIGSVKPFRINISLIHNLAATYNTVEEPGASEDDAMGSLPPRVDATQQEGIKQMKVILPEAPSSRLQGNLRHIDHLADLFE